MYAGFTHPVFVGTSSCPIVPGPILDRWLKMCFWEPFVMSQNRQLPPGENNISIQVRASSSETTFRTKHQFQQQVYKLFTVGCEQRAKHCSTKDDENKLKCVPS